MARQKKPVSDTAAPRASGMNAVSPVAPHAWLEMANACAQFSVDRLHQDLKARRAFVKCQTPMDVMQQQIAYCHGVSQLYANQSTRLFALMTKGAQHSGRAAHFGPSRKYDDIPL